MKILEKALYESGLAGLPDNNPIGARFTFTNKDGDTSVISGTIIGLEFSSTKELLLYVSVPSFLGLRLTRLEYGSSTKTWYARTDHRPRSGPTGDSYNARYCAIAGLLEVSPP